MGEQRAAPGAGGSARGRGPVPADGEGGVAPAREVRVWGPLAPRVTLGVGDASPAGSQRWYQSPPRGTKEPSEPSPSQMTTSITVPANAHGHRRLAGHRCPRPHLRHLQPRGHVPRVSTPQVPIAGAAMLPPGDRPRSEQLRPRRQGATRGNTGRPVPRAPDRLGRAGRAERDAEGYSGDQPPSAGPGPRPPGRLPQRRVRLLHGVSALAGGPTNCN